VLKGELTTLSEEDEANLVDLGLTMLQARVYLALLRLGNTRAPRLASVVGVVRPEIYRILRELSARGLAHRSLTSPSTYMATPPNVVLPLLARQIRERLANFELKSDALMKSLSSISPEHSDVTDHRITLLEAFDRANQEFKQMVNEAEEEYVGITGRDALKQLSNDDLVRPILSASKRKVKVRIITEIDGSNVKVAEQLSRHVELRTSQNILFYVDIVDRKKMLFGPAYLHSDQAIKRRELDLLTTDPRFISGMHAMFERIWETCPGYATKQRR
jgi:HTH-type transcriptional regulator, sugar sensing transcriptional regulator